MIVTCPGCRTHYRHRPGPERRARCSRCDARFLMPQAARSYRLESPADPGPGGSSIGMDDPGLGPKVARNAFNVPGASPLTWAVKVEETGAGSNGAPSTDASVMPTEPPFVPPAAEPVVARPPDAEAAESEFLPEPEPARDPGDISFDAPAEDIETATPGFSLDFPEPPEADEASATPEVAGASGEDSHFPEPMSLSAEPTSGAMPDVALDAAPGSADETDLDGAPEIPRVAEAPEPSLEEFASSFGDSSAPIDDRDFEAAGEAPEGLEAIPLASQGAVADPAADDEPAFPEDPAAIVEPMSMQAPGASTPMADLDPPSHGGLSGEAPELDPALADRLYSEVETASELSGFEIDPPTRDRAPSERPRPVAPAPAPAPAVRAPVWVLLAGAALAGAAYHGAPWLQEWLAGSGLVRIPEFFLRPPIAAVLGGCVGLLFGAGVARWIQR